MSSCGSCSGSFGMWSYASLTLAGSKCCQREWAPMQWIFFFCTTCSVCVVPVSPCVSVYISVCLFVCLPVCFGCLLVTLFDRWRRGCSTNDDVTHDWCNELEMLAERWAVLWNSCFDISALYLLTESQCLHQLHNSVSSCPQVYSNLLCEKSRSRNW